MYNNIVVYKFDISTVAVRCYKSYLRYKHEARGNNCKPMLEIGLKSTLYKC